MLHFTVADVMTRSVLAVPVSSSSAGSSTSYAARTSCEARRRLKSTW